MYISFLSSTPTLSPSLNACVCVCVQVQAQGEQATAAAQSELKRMTSEVERRKARLERKRQEGGERMERMKAGLQVRR